MHQPGLTKELRAGVDDRLSIPVVCVWLQRNTQRLHRIGNLFTDVQTVCEFPTKYCDDASVGVGLDLVFS